MTGDWIAFLLFEDLRHQLRLHYAINILCPGATRQGAQIMQVSAILPDSFFELR